MHLLADTARCHGHDCKERHFCARFIDLHNGVNPRTGYFASLHQGAFPCLARVPTPSDDTPGEAA